MANVSKKYNLKIIKRKKKDKQITQKNKYVNKGQKQKKIKMLINTCAMNNQNNLKKKEKNVAKRLLGNMQEKHF